MPTVRGAQNGNPDALVEALRPLLQPLARLVAAEAAREMVALMAAQKTSPPTPAPPKFLIEAEAARILRVSVRTVQDACKAGRIRHVLLGRGQRRIPIVALVELAEAQMAEDGKVLGKRPGPELLRLMADMH